MGGFFQNFYIEFKLKSLFYIIFFSIFFWALGLLGLQLQSTHLGVTPFWPASGLTFGAFFIFGFWLWPGVVIGMCALALSIDIPLSVASFSALVTILESSVAIYIARRFNFIGRLDSFREGLIFSAVTVFAPVIPAFLGGGMMTVMSPAHVMPPMDMMMVWWLGNSLGILLMGGGLLSLYASKNTISLKHRFNERLAIVLAVIFVFLLAATQSNGLDSALMVNLLIPIIFLSSLRFGACAALGLSLIFVMLMSVFSGYPLHSTPEQKHFGFQYLILVKIWFVSISGVLIAGAFKDNIERERLAWLAMHDALTGLANRLAMEDDIDVSLKGVRSSDNDVCLLFLDVDNFKPINDELGHQRGDQVLVKIAHVLKDSVRHVDTVARWGGDEFIILLRQCSHQQARDIAHKINGAIQFVSFQQNKKHYPVSMSIGIATAILGETKVEFIERADAACYAAKNNGRNQSVLA